MTINLINNVAFLIALVAAGGIVISKFHNNPLNRQLLLGILFGSVTLLGMLNPVNFAPGVIFDGRSIVLSVAGLVGGGLTAVVAAGMAAVYRFYLGGGGAAVGITTIVLSAVLGVLARLWLSQRASPPKPTHYFLVGVAVQVMQLAAFTQIPNRAGYAFIEQAWWILLLFYPLATMLLSLSFRTYEQLLKDQLALQNAQQASARERSILRTLIDSLPNLIWLKDSEGRYITCNHRFAQLLGTTENEIVGKSDHDLLDKSHADRQRHDDRLAIERSSPYVSEEEVSFASDGHRELLETTKIPMRDPQGQLIGILGIGHDITARKKNENRIKESHDRLLTVLNSLDAVVYVADMTTHEVLFANKYTRDNIGDIEGRICWQSLQQGQAGPCDFCSNDKLLTRDGEIALPYVWEFQNTVNKRWYHIVDRAMRWIDGRIVRMEIATDITDRKQLEGELLANKIRLEKLVATRTSELEHAKNEAVAANMAKSAFLANMSHEIRTPLNAITGMAHLMQRYGVAPEQSERLSRINVASQHLLEVINAVLDLSKIEAGQFSLEEADLSIDRIVSNVRGMIQPQADKKNLGLKLDVDPLPMGLLGDATRIQQALLNYAANAIKFTNQGAITLRAKRIDATVENVLIRFEVQDTGIGIAPEILPRLFAAFEQADNSITREYGGTGLGLAITKKLAQLMGGDAGVQSASGEGSTFWFTCRLKLAKKAMPLGPVQGREDAEMILSRDYAGTRVLLVEDEPVNREVARMFLEDAGFEIDEAENGAEGVRMAQSNDYSIILMDMQMPVLDGLEATRQLRQIDKFKAIPILAMTANAFAEDKDRCLEAGMDDFLTKPVEPDQLYATLLAQLVNTTRARQQEAQQG